jgi:hypothetical protein
VHARIVCFCRIARVQVHVQLPMTNTDTDMACYLRLCCLFVFVCLFWLFVCTWTDFSRASFMKYF